MRYRGLLRAALAPPLLLGLLTGGGGPSGSCPGAGYTERFHQALAAARADDWAQVAALEPCLGEAHPMAAYLDFHRLRADLPGADPGRVVAYRERYADTPLAAVMERMALRRYAEAGRYAAVRRVSPEPPERLALGCHWWRAHLADRRGEALAFAADAWQAGESQPAACNGLFDAAREAGAIDERAVWQRMRLAYRNADAGLMRYLKGLLDGARWLSAAEWLQRLDRDPGAVEALDGAVTPVLRRQLTADALWRLAEVDTEAALARLQATGKALPPLLDGERRAIERRIAWYSTIRGVAANRAWLDRWLAEQQAPELVAQRLRRAVAEQDWTDVLFWHARLPGDQAGSAHWQYWLGRARAALGDEPGARQAWRAAARERSFWGFLAAERTGRPYALQAADPDPAAPAPRPGVLRVRILREGGKLRLARDEWRHLLATHPEQRTALAAHANRQGWHGLAIEAALEAGAYDALAWRFPHAYREAFRRAAEQAGAGPYLLMAVARRESGLSRDAVSSADARGLMQLRPAATREAARRLDRPAPEAGALSDPARNIELGAAYLDGLLERFAGNRPVALAAYNAGPGRVASWLEAEPQPFDVWIESIPYRETRHYVQAVLAYRAILARRDGAAVRASVLSGREMRQAYGREPGSEPLRLSQRTGAGAGIGIDTAERSEQGGRRADSP